MPLTMAPEDVGMFRQSVGPLTHLIALERPGPSHTPGSVIGGVLDKLF